MSEPAPTPAPAHRHSLAAGLVVVVLWGASFSIQKPAYAAMTPGGYLFARSLLMSLLALVLLRLSGHAVWPRLDRADWGLLLRATLVGQVLHIIFMAYGIHYSTPFISSVITACGPVITLLLLRFLHGVRLRPPQVAGVAAALTGVLLFMGDRLARAEMRASAGDLLVLVGAALFSLYTIRVVPLVRRHGGTSVMCWTTLLAAPAVLTVTSVPAMNAPWTQVSPQIWLAFGWSVVVAAFAGWLVWSWVNMVRGVGRTAPLLYLIPPVAGVIGWIWLGEAMGTVKLLGAAVAMAGVALAQWAGQRPAPA